MLYEWTPTDAILRTTNTLAVYNAKKELKQGSSDQSSDYFRMHNTGEERKYEGQTNRWLPLMHVKVSRGDERDDSTKNGVCLGHVG